MVFAAALTDSARWRSLASLVAAALATSAAVLAVAAYRVRSRRRLACGAGAGNAKASPARVADSAASVDEARRTAPDFAALKAEVSAVSAGRFSLVDTEERGRCLVAAASLQVGARVRDVPIVPHGSDRGDHLLAAVSPGLIGGQDASAVGGESCEDDAVVERLGSPDLVAALDFLASLSAALAAGSSYALWALHRFEGKNDEEVEGAAMVRRWHGRWRSEIGRVPVETVEAAWRHVVPNWRQLTASLPRGCVIEDDRGKLQVALGHETICGLWLLMALCEHSCDPNCALVHDGRDLSFVVLRPIAQGEPVTTSYLNLQGLAQQSGPRREGLSRSWGFSCECSRCLKDLAADRSQEASRSAAARRSPAQVLLERCQAPPRQGDDEEEYATFCDGVEALCRLARKLHGGAQEPAGRSLSLLSAVFAPRGERRDRACAELRAISSTLCGGEASAEAQWAELLARDPAAILRRAVLEATSDTDAVARALSSDTMDLDGSPVDELRELYRRYLVSRSWPRRRFGGTYVASAVSITKKPEAAATADKATSLVKKST